MTSPAPECALPGSPLAQVRGGIDACVHCGFCLQACPTYTALEDENDSPRGRVFLMRSLLEGSLAPRDESAREHIDRCLGCRACETACPSGVPYGHLLEATRATLGEYGHRPVVARIVLAVFAREWLLRPALGVARALRATRLPALFARLGGRLGTANAMLDSTRTPVARRSYRPLARRDAGRVTTLTGCVMEGLFTETNRATERVLLQNDYDVVPTKGQRCCGALHAHAGDLEAARALARANIAAFERTNADFIAVNSAGCGAMMKEYAQLLAGDAEWAARAAAVSARVRDVTELLAARGPRPAGPLSVRVTYDAPCHLQHAQRVTAPPIETLAAIEGLELVPLAGSDRCCGAAGIYNLVQPETSAAVLTPKLQAIDETRAEFVVSGNPGCLMQIGGGLLQANARARAIHPVDLLDAAYGAGRER